MSSPAETSDRGGAPVELWDEVAGLGHDLLDLIYSILASPTWKVVGAAALVVAEAALGPWNGTYTAIAILWTADFVLGIWYAALHRAVSMRGLLRGLVKAILYLALMAIARQVEVALGGYVGSYAAWFGTAMVVMTEAGSAVRNGNRLADYFEIDLPPLRAMGAFLASASKNPAAWKGRQGYDR